MICMICDKCPKCGRYFIKYLPDKFKKDLEKEKACIFCGCKLLPKDLRISQN